MRTLLSAYGRMTRRRVTSLLVSVTCLSTIYVLLLHSGAKYNVKGITLPTETEPPVLVAPVRKVRTDLVKVKEDDVKGNRSYFQLGLLQQGHMSRIKHLRHECEGKEKQLFGKSTKDWAYARIEIDKKYNSLYCPLLKVGSTFFRRLFFSLRQGKDFANPYAIPIMRALSAKADRIPSLGPFESAQLNNFVRESTSIMFVREPFARLLSGYTDKLFAPNPYFWSQIGQHVVEKFRKRGKSCGHDVTFAEFVQYVIDSELVDDSHRDAHFTPTYDQCKPCSLNYTLVGKMETFMPDVAFTLERLLGQQVSKEKLKMWGADATLDAIVDSTNSPWGWRGQIARCMNWNEAVRRIWRKLQIRAIIPLEEKFPWDLHTSLKQIPARAFITKVRQINAKADKERLKRQKLEVLAEAFSTVNPEHVALFTRIFMPDFELFQYDPKPNFIYDEQFVSQYRNRKMIFNLDTV